MRKRMRKLALHRETLADLDRSSLKEAVGAATTFATCPSYTCYPGNCDFTGRATCTSCQFTCTTNLC